MSRWEVTNERPTEYSTWHRTLPNSCPYTDIDLVEVRKGKIVAIIETKRGLYKRNLNPNRSWNWQKSILIQLSKKLDCKVFLIEYDIDIENYDNNLFDITDLFTDKEYPNITNYKYCNFCLNFNETILTRRKIITCSICGHSYDSFEYVECQNCKIEKNKTDLFGE